MSVILAATALASQTGAFSPQHVNNWSIEFYGLPGNILSGNDSVTFSLARGFLPAFVVDDVTIPFGNEEVHVAGRARYEAGNLEIRDYVDQDIEGMLVNWYALVYGGPVGNFGFVGVPASYKRIADVLMTAPDGTAQRSWRLQGAWPVTMNFGGLDMASSEQVQVTISIRYDRAVYNGARTSVTSMISQAQQVAGTLIANA